MGTVNRFLARPLWRTAYFIILFNGLFFACLLLKIGSPDLRIALDDCAVALGPLLMALLCFFFGRRLWSSSQSNSDRNSVALRWVPVLLGMGLLSYAIGQSIWTYYELVLHQLTPFPSLGDAGYLVQVQAACCVKEGKVVKWRHESPHVCPTAESC